MDSSRQTRAAGIDSRFTALFRNHYDEVLGYCVRRTIYADAQDCASEVFVVAWRRIDELQWDTARPWLYGIARGVLANRRRSADRRIRLTRKVSGLAQGTAEDPNVIVVRAEQDAEVMDALSKLKDSDREILILSTWEELTSPEIAVALNISTSAAEQRLHRAKQRFARHLKDIPQDAQFTPRAVKEGGGR